METISLTTQRRERVGKGGSRALRRSGQVPAVLYGAGRESLSLSIQEVALRDAIGAARHSVLELDLGSGTTELAVVKQIQRHPIKHHILHLDLLIVNMDEDVDLPVMVVLKGEPAGVGEGGVLDHQLRQVTVRGRPNLIPESIEVDVSDLDIGGHVSVGQLEVPSGLEILDEADALVASILAPRREEEEVGVPEGTEPEEIGEGGQPDADGEGSTAGAE